MRTYSRRQFAMGLGAAMVAAPFMTRPAQAAEGRARRLIVFFSPNGTVHRFWRPTVTGPGAGDFTFSPGSILEPLSALREHLLVLDGIDFIGVNNHEAGMANMLTGGGGAGSASRGMSVDQYVAAQVGGDSRFASLEFGVQTSAWGGNVQTRMSYAGPGTFVTPEDSPRSAYGRLFGAPLQTGQAERLLLSKKSVLDLVRGELSELRGRVGKQEKEKLDQHLEALRRTERGLVSPGGCERPTAPLQLDAYAHANFPAIAKAQRDLLLLSLSCGMTKVASLQYSHTVGPPVFSWVGAREGHHELSHKGDGNTLGVASFVLCERWYAEQFALLVSALEAAPDPEGGGSLLSTSLVLWAKELGDGRLHTCQSVPFVLAGGAGGALRTGRYLRYQGAPHQQLLTSVCRLMGLPIAAFGDAGKGTGTLEGLL